MNGPEVGESRDLGSLELIVVPDITNENGFAGKLDGVDYVYIFRFMSEVLQYPIQKKAANYAPTASPMKTKHYPRNLSKL